MGRFLVETTGLCEWRSRLKDPELHWKRGASSMELAVAWTAARRTKRGLPVLVAECLDQVPQFRGCEVELAIPELRTPLPGGKTASQTDLWARLQGPQGSVGLAVEGKAKEPFSEIARDWLATNKSGGREERIEFLAGELGIDAKALLDVRYQLIHRTVAALLEARKWHTDHAVMLVQRFSAAPEQRSASWSDFVRFLAVLHATPEPGVLVQVSVPGEIPLYTGWLDCRLATDAEIAMAAS